jgi:hypothetical protein
MTVADTNVRPAWRSPATNARGARPSGLARLLLEILQKLDRKAALLSLLAASLMPACVIPVGPEWQDPIGIPNSGPEILDPQPDWGAERSITGMGQQRFQFDVRDINVGEPIFVEFFADDQRVVRLMFANAGPTPQRQRVDTSIACADVDKMLMRHSIKAAVADQRFTDDDPNNPLAVANDGRVAVITWTLNVTCLLSP